MDSLTRQFRDREVEKEYVAVLHGVPHPGVGRVETLIGRSSRDRKKMSVQDTHGRTAITTYHLSEVFDGFCCRVTRIYVNQNIDYCFLF